MTSVDVEDKDCLPSFFKMMEPNRQDRPVSQEVLVVGENRTVVPHRGSADGKAG
jgi:hypothetical protein